jgi:hypothetical protein
MPQLDARRTYADGAVLFAADLDAIVDDIETLFNTTGLNDDNLQNAGITASTKLIDATITAGKLASSSVTTAKIDALAVTTAKIALLNVTTATINDLAVTTGKIAALAVTTAKIAALNVTSAELAADSVITTKILDSNVTTAKIAAANVTAAKMESSINLPGASVKVDSKFVTVGATQALSLIRSTHALHVGAGNSGSLAGGTFTEDGNLGYGDVTFTTAFAAAPLVLVTAGDGKANDTVVTLSLITTTGFRYTDSTGGQTMTAFDFLVIGTK